VLVNQIGKLKHQVASISSGKILPGGVFEGFASCFDSDIDVL
jgi:hypothetical protein